MSGNKDKRSSWEPRSYLQDPFKLKYNKKKCSCRVTWVQIVNIIFYSIQSLLSRAYFQSELMWVPQPGSLLLVSGVRGWFSWHPVCSSSRTCSAATMTARIRAPLLKSSYESACCRQSSDWRESLSFKVLQQQLWPWTWLVLSFAHTIMR